MPRLIDADALRKNLLETIRIYEKGGRVERTAGLYNAVDAVINSPTIEAEPVKHGRWIFDGEWWNYYCTNCHRSIGNIRTYPYCPNCGAKMDGGAENEMEI